jgi:hypothetical protein
MLVQGLQVLVSCWALTTCIAVLPAGRLALPPNDRRVIAYAAQAPLPALRPVPAQPISTPPHRAVGLHLCRAAQRGFTEMPFTCCVSRPNVR